MNAKSVFENRYLSMKYPWNIPENWPEFALKTHGRWPQKLVGHRDLGTRTRFWKNTLILLLLFWKNSIFSPTEFCKSLEKVDLKTITNNGMDMCMTMSVYVFYVLCLSMSVYVYIQVGVTLGYPDCYWWGMYNCAPLAYSMYWCIGDPYRRFIYGVSTSVSIILGICPSHITSNFLKKSCFTKFGQKATVNILAKNP